MKISEVEVYPHYYENFYKLISSEISLIELLDQRRNTILDFYNSIPIEKWDYKYQENKWSIKKLVRHIIDAELIFNYRTLSFVRGEKQALLGWSEDDYAENINEAELSSEKLLHSLNLQINYSYDLFSNFTIDDLKKIGNANGLDTEVGAIGFCIIAHELHHRNIIKERYLNL